MFRFEELEIWKLAIKYANEIYDLTEKFPSSERYNLINQIRRASLSISNNIAEGSGSSTDKNFGNSSATITIDVTVRVSPDEVGANRELLDSHLTRNVKCSLEDDC